MIDCGEGAQIALIREKLKLSRLTDIFLTHLHVDHVMGLPGLLSTLWMDGLGANITIHTFEEGKKILTEILSFFSPGMLSLIRFNVIAPDNESVILDDDDIAVRTIPLDHRVNDVGYLFNAKRAPLSYAHISDTAYMPSLAEKIKGVDLLYHETTFLDKNTEKAFARGHSTSTQAAMVARDANVGTLLTGHYSSSIKDDRLIYEEARKIFPNVILNREGLVCDIVAITKGILPNN